jgi:hypothetical protein
MIVEKTIKLILYFLPRDSARSVGIKFLKLGAFLVFEHKRGHVDKDLKFEEDLTRLKHAINYETYIGAQFESGGHILRSAKCISSYTAISVLNVLRKPDLYFSELQNTEHFKKTSIINPYEEKWHA